MSVIVLTVPIFGGKVKALQRFCQELSGSPLQVYISSRRRLGITHEQMALIEIHCGSTAVTTVEASDVSKALEQIIASRLPFDIW
jgi:hypothetical protein